MRIAIFTDTFVPALNGVAMVSAQSAKELAKRGHQIWVFTVGQRAAGDSFWQEGKINLTRLPSIPTGGIYKDSRLSLPLGIAWRQLKKFQPNIIHTHTPFSVGWEAVWVARQLKKPLIGTHHTFYDHYLKHIKADFGWMKKFSWRYTAFYYNFCDLVLAPSSALAKTMTANGLKRPVMVLQNAIDTDLFKPAISQTEKDTLKKSLGIKGDSICYIGRVSYEKSIDQVILAFRQILEKRPDLTLVIAGGGPEKEKLAKLAKRLGIEKQIIFTGFYKCDENIVNILRANELFVTASKSESFGIAVLEAMAVGLPVVTVKEKGFLDFVEDGVNGYFAKTDDPLDIAQKILAILADQELKEKFGQASRRLAERFSIEKITTLTENIYKNLIIKK